MSRILPWLQAAWILLGLWIGWLIAVELLP